MIQKVMRKKVRQRGALKNSEIILDKLKMRLTHNAPDTKNIAKNVV